MRLCLAFAISVLPFFASAEPALLELDSQLVIDTRLKEFGGLSGLTMHPDGGGATILNDRNRIFEVGIARDEEGRLTAVNVLTARYLYLYDPSVPVDSEGLARGPDGSIFVSTERRLSVLQYASGQNWPTPAPEFPDLSIWNRNRGLEALAVDGEGRLVTIPEVVPRGASGHPIFRLEDGGWTEIASLPPDGSFTVVGADIGPDDRLYILERAVSLLGFRSRIRRLDPPFETATPVTLLETHVSEFDNLEGISLWRDEQGQTRITLVSDNNFLRVQKTEIVEFLLTE